MAEVHIVDIDGEQWDIKDLPLTERVTILETKFSEMKAIRHDISQNPLKQFTCLWDCVMNQIPNTDWSFIQKDFWAYGLFAIQTICWGIYEAIRHTDDSLEIKGTLTYNAVTQTFSAFYYADTNEWSFQVDGEAFAYLQNNILITQTVDRQFNQFSVPSQLFVRNIAPTTIGDVYAALEASGLLNRPSVGVIVWDLRRNHDGIDLPKAHMGYPAYASSSEIILSGRVYLQNPRVGSVNSQTEDWIFNWSDGNSYADANMWGELFEGVVPTVSLAFTA